MIWNCEQDKQSEMFWERRADIWRYFRFLLGLAFRQAAINIHTREVQDKRSLPARSEAARKRCLRAKRNFLFFIRKSNLIVPREPSSWPRKKKKPRQEWNEKESRIDNLLRLRSLHCREVLLSSILRHPIYHLFHLLETVFFLERRHSKLIMHSTISLSHRTCFPAHLNVINLGCDALFSGFREFEPRQLIFPLRLGFMVIYDEYVLHMRIPLPGFMLSTWRKSVIWNTR